MTVELREVGRVLSAGNVKKLLDAKATLEALLSLAAVDREVGDDEEEDEIPAPEEAVHEAFAYLSDAVGVDLLECKPGCEYCPGEDEEDDEDDVEESANLGGLVDLEEAAVRQDGTASIKIISPGWGSSGYYSKEVLQRDGPKAWPAGTQMFWDHPTPQEEAARPERSLRDLAAVLVTAPRWEDSGKHGPGLYAEAKVRGEYREAINELAPHIGTSIRASGKATEGIAEGKKGRIVEAIVQGKSVDFVTMPGRGGKVLELFEAARGSNKEVTDDVSTAELREAREKLAASEAENRALREAALGSAATTFASKHLAAAGLHPAAVHRLLESIYVEDVPTTNDGSLDEASFKQTLDEAIAAEKAYIAALSGKGRVEGFGASTATALGEGGGTPSNGVSLDEAKKELTEAFKALGMSDSEAAIAASGRN